MSVTLTLEDEIDISRGDMLGDRAAAWSASGSRPRWSGWTSGRSIPARVYLLKHTTRTVTAEIDHGLVLNQIGTVTVSTARPLMFDRYDDESRHGQLHPHRPGDALHRRRRDDRQRGARAAARRSRRRR